MVLRISRHLIICMLSFAGGLSTNEKEKKGKLSNDSLGYLSITKYTW